MMSDYDRLLKAAMIEFKRGVESEVERAFELALKAMQSGEACEIPVIGDPFPPPEYRAGLKERVIAALCAREWFTHEAPKWAPPLPLKLNDCHALFNGENRGNRRFELVGQYGILLRDMGWDFQRAPPFEVFCSQVLSPPG
jgi:hypothetical protein